MKTHISLVRYNYLIIFGLLFSASVSLFFSLNPIALYLIIPAIFVYCLHQYNSFDYNRSIHLLTIWFVWIMLSLFGANNLITSFNTLKEILGGVILSFIMYILSQNKRYIPWLYLSFIFYYIFLWVYIYRVFGLVDINLEKERFGDENLNSNTLSYYTFYAAVAIFMLGELATNNLVKMVFRILYFGIILVVPLVAVFAASRQALIVILPNVLLLLLFRYRSRFSLNLIFTSLLFMLLGFYFYNNYFGEIYESSYLKARSEIDIKDDSRLLVLQEALGVGIDNPFLGVGPGNFMYYSSERMYSHCSYTELFANSGLTAVLLFIWMILNFIKDQYTRYIKTKSKLFLYLLTIGIFWSIYNVFFVFYQNLWLISFLFLLVGHSDQYNKSLKENK